jgi:hypothetical protein
MFALLAGLLSPAAACSDDDNGPEATATAAPADATAAPDIRQEDLTAQPNLRAFLDASNGEVDPERIEYADLTEDGVDEAVVPVGSGGEGGDIGVFVYGYTADGLSALLSVVTENQSIAAEVEGTSLKLTEPVYGEGDPLCCPSAFRLTTYAWDGSALAVEETQTVEGTPSKSKDDN